MDCKKMFVIQGTDKGFVPRQYYELQETLKEIKDRSLRKPNVK